MMALVFQPNTSISSFPFFSTRGEKGGTGLGLSICHGIVEEHRGRIYAKSKMGEGATLFVELPVTT